MQIFSYKKFQSGDALTLEQINFFREFGFIHFEQLLTESDVNNIIDSTKNIERDWISNDIKQVNGVPIKYGIDENGAKIVQRFAFANQFSAPITDFINDPRIQALKSLLPDKDARLAPNEKDGVVVNHYVNTPNSNYKQLGWHTDSARDIFYGFKINPMLNIGLYLDDSDEENGGLRVLPGTHRQGIFSMLFKKAYFLNNNNDKKEILIKTKKGDVVVHDGRMWHRVGKSPHFGARSRRRVLYAPLIAGKYQPKDANSKTPFYHRFQKLAEIK